MNCRSFDQVLSGSMAEVIETVKRKDRKPHHSEINAGKFELLSVDDDPVNQAMSFENSNAAVDNTAFEFGIGGHQRAPGSVGMHHYCSNGRKRSAGTIEIERIPSRFDPFRCGNAAQIWI